MKAGGKFRAVQQWAQKSLASGRQSARRIQESSGHVNRLTFILRGLVAVGDGVESTGPFYFVHSLRFAHILLRIEAREQAATGQITPHCRPLHDSYAFLGP